MFLKINPEEFQPGGEIEIKGPGWFGVCAECQKPFMAEASLMAITCCHCGDVYLICGACSLALVDDEFFCGPKH